VRNLEREIANLIRKAVKEIVTKKSKTSIEVTAKNLETYAGVPKVPLRRDRGRGSGRRRHRPGLDRGRRRAADDRGGHDARQGQA
jgi:hypothetical protein